MPITWRNVDGNRGAIDAALIMRGAGQSLNTGFDQLEGVIANTKALRDKNFTDQGDLNTSAAKDILAKYTDVASLEKAKADGTLAAELQALGPNVDRDVIRSGASDRLLALRNEANATYEYDLNNTRREAAPLEQEFYKNLYLNTKDGDKAAKALLEKNNDLFTRAGLAGDMARDFTTTNRAELEQARSDQSYMEEQRIKGANRTFDGLVAAGLEKGQSAAEARQYVVDEARRLGVAPEVLNQRILEVDRGFENRYGLTTEQRAEHDAIAGSAQARAAAEQAQLDRALEIEESAYKDMTAFDAGAAPSATVADVVTEAEAAGWDRTSWGLGDDMANNINKEVEQFQKTYEKAAGERLDPGVMGAVAKEALRRVGKPGESIFDNNDLPAKQFEANMVQVLQEYNQRLQAKEQLENTRNQHLLAVQSSQTAASQAVSANLKKYRGDALARQLR